MKLQRKLKQQLIFRSFIDWNYKQARACICKIHQLLRSTLSCLIIAPHQTTFSVNFKGKSHLDSFHTILPPKYWFREDVEFSPIWSLHKFLYFLVFSTISLKCWWNWWTWFIWFIWFFNYCVITFDRSPPSPHSYLDIPPTPLDYWYLFFSEHPWNIVPPLQDGVIFILARE